MVEIINENSKEKGHELITFEGLSDSYPHQEFNKDRHNTFTVTSHCELNVATHFYHNRGTSRIVEIGVSKRLCWLCQRYLEILLLFKKMRVVVSGNQGKIHAGWAMPPGTPYIVKSQMRELIEAEISYIRESVIARRKSGSLPGEDRENFAQDGFDYIFRDKSDWL